MSDSVLISRPASSPEEVQARASLKKDPRYRAGAELVKTAREISAPAYTQERSAGEVIGSTIIGIARAEALRKKGENLPQNKLKARLETAPDSLAELTGKGAVLRETT